MQQEMCLNLYRATHKAKRLSSNIWRAVGAPMIVSSCTRAAAQKRTTMAQPKKTSQRTLHTTVSGCSGLVQGLVLISKVQTSAKVSRGMGSRQSLHTGTADVAQMQHLSTMSRQGENLLAC